MIHKPRSTACTHCACISGVTGARWRRVCSCGMIPISLTAHAESLICDQWLCQTTPPAAAVATEAADEEEGARSDYRIFGSSVYRALTPVEFEADPSIIVVLTDEATLGQILALPVPHNIIPRLGGGGGPHPNTAAVKLWFRNLVAVHCRTVAADLKPQLTANRPFAENVMLFHQLRSDEVQAILSFLGL